MSADGGCQDRHNFIGMRAAVGYDDLPCVQACCYAGGVDGVNAAAVLQPAGRKLLPEQPADRVVAYVGWRHTANPTCRVVAAART